MYYVGSLQGSFTIYQRSMSEIMFSTTGLQNQCFVCHNTTQAIKLAYIAFLLFDFGVFYS